MWVFSRKYSPVPQNGFSLIEIIVSMVIISFLGIVIFSVFSQGLKLWKRAVKIQPDIQSDITFETASSDLRNAFIGPERPFSGTDKALEFLSFSKQEMSDAEAGIRIKKPVLVRYLYDSEMKILKRSEESLRSLLSEPKYREEPLWQPVAEGVKECRFDFYHVLEDKRGYQWKSFWREGCLPRAIRISILYDDHLKIGRSSKIISVPAGAVCGGGK